MPVFSPQLPIQLRKMIYSKCDVLSQYNVFLADNEAWTKDDMYATFSKLKELRSVIMDELTKAFTDIVCKHMLQEDIHLCYDSFSNPNKSVCILFDLTKSDPDPESVDGAMIDSTVLLEFIYKFTDNRLINSNDCFTTITTTITSTYSCLNQPLTTTIKDLNKAADITVDMISVNTHSDEYIGTARDEIFDSLALREPPLSDRSLLLEASLEYLKLYGASENFVLKCQQHIYEYNEYYPPRDDPFYRLYTRSNKRIPWVRWIPESQR